MHALVSSCAAVLAGILVFWLWYPAPYASIVGGSSLFFILIAVDVVMGPALTAVAADPAKPSPVFARDLVVIVALQVGALGYGVYVMSAARPVILAFEIDRMRLLVAADVDRSLLEKAEPQWRDLPWNGPRLVATARPATREEQLRAVDLALGGLDIGHVPANWRPYETQAISAMNAARGAPELLQRYPGIRADLDRFAATSAVPLTELRYLPLVSRLNGGSVILAPPDGRVVGVLAVDGFL